MRGLMGGRWVWRFGGILEVAALLALLLGPFAPPVVCGQDGVGQGDGLANATKQGEEGAASDDVNAGGHSYNVPAAARTWTRCGSGGFATASSTGTWCMTR